MMIQTLSFCLPFHFPCDLGFIVFFNELFFFFAELFFNELFDSSSRCKDNLRTAINMLVLLTRIASATGVLVSPKIIN